MSENRLVKEKSPYLLQHARNPVDWYPWGEEAFQKAKKENKPVLLSIGYSTCHWCHVMEHESFEDEEVARLMNDTFVSIKVDREERPDIDNIYMAICQMLTGSGGWPLTIFMTPDKQPFFAATYIPKEQRFGRVGMLQLIPRIKEIWEQRNDEVLRSAAEITRALQDTTLASSGNLLGEQTLTLAYEQLFGRYDRIFGGFGDAPKFPTPHQLLFLLRSWKRSGNPEPLEMVEKTLQAMRRGGIYDHLGFGFHRYSTDRDWLVPHFEKMLYDQAMLAMAYTETFQATRNPEYAKTAGEIFTYVLRDMTSPEGGFYSAEDADSEGQEGKFYVWTAEELRSLLGSDADLILEIWNIEENGNFVDQVIGHKTSENILHQRKSLAELAARHKISESELVSRLESARQKLFEHREKRIHPHKDDKILTDWNGLMTAAFAIAARVLNQSVYVDAAKRSVEFLLDKLRKPDGELMHRYRDGEAAIRGHLDDYAFLIWGLLELYETTFETRHLRTSLELNEYLIQHFWDSSAGGFYFTADKGEPLLIRTKEIYDGALPSGNSVSMLNLLRLSRLTGNLLLEKYSEQIERAFSRNVGQIPVAHTQLMLALDFRVGPSYEVLIAGDPDSGDTQSFLSAIRTQFLPNKVVLLRSEKPELADIISIAPFTGSQRPLEGKATAYVCQNFVCNAPTTDAGRMIDLLQSSHQPDRQS